MTCLVIIGVSFDYNRLDIGQSRTRLLNKMTNYTVILNTILLTVYIVVFKVRRF